MTEETGRTRYSIQMRGILCMETSARSYVLFSAATAGSIMASPRTATCRSRKYACQSCKMHQKQAYFSLMNHTQTGASACYREMHIIIIVSKY